ncbi:MAG: hypothetical protein M1133_11140 [Armatimonadetes bacterium]|nr:hypothetical protein [Armatimonadota bacterium]
MNPLVGVIVAVLSAILVGSFMIPMKKTPKWEWENTWLVYSLVGLIIAPCTVAFITVPNLLGALRDSGGGVLLMVFLFGLGWGFGSNLFGRGSSIIGVGLGFAITIGLLTGVGALVPLVMKPEVFLTPSGLTVTAGVLLTLVGVAISGRAGISKETQERAAEQRSGASEMVKPEGSYAKGLIYCIVSGAILLPMLNFAFVFGAPIMKSAIANGASSVAASDASWTIACLGGFLGNFIFLAAILNKRKTWSVYRTSRAGLDHWFFAGLMGILWLGGVATYGRAAAIMGTLGPSAGWAIFNGGSIAVAGIWGVIAGEWRTGKGKPIRTMYAGLVVLALAVIVLGYGNSLTH